MSLWCSKVSGEENLGIVQKQTKKKAAPTANILEFDVTDYQEFKRKELKKLSSLRKAENESRLVEMGNTVRFQGVQINI